MAVVTDTEKPGNGPGLEPEQVATLDALAAEAEGEQGPAVAGPAPEQSPEVVGPPSGELLLPVVTMAAATMAPAWQLKETECQALADAYGAIIDKYIPGGLGSLGVELNAAMITAAIFLPRMGKPRFPEQEQGEQDKKPEPPKATPADTGGDFLKPAEPKRKPAARKKAASRKKAA